MAKAKKKVIRKKSIPKKRVTRNTVKRELKTKGKRLVHGYELKPRSITGIMSQGKKMIVKMIGEKETQKFVEKTKRGKNKIARQIAELKKSYRKLS